MGSPEVDLSDIPETSVDHWSLPLLEELSARSNDFELALLLGVVALRVRYGLDIYEEVYAENPKDNI